MAYEAPFTPPSILPGASFLAAALNSARQNDRSDEYLDMEREGMRRNQEQKSAEVLRQEEARKRREAIETWASMPALFRAAHKSVGFANQNPYGVKFNEQYDLPSNVEGPELSPTAEAARFAPHEAPEPRAAPTQPDLTRTHMPSPSVPLGQHSGGPVQPEPELPISAQAAATAMGQPGPEGQKRLFASYQGSQFEVPEQSDRTPFGPDYDTIYQGLIETGEDPHKAMQYVAAEYKAEQTQKSIAKRTADQIDYRNKNREDVQTFAAGENEKYKLTFEQRKELTNIMARAKVASAGAQPIPAGVSTLVGMKEQGATDEEIYAKAAELRLTGKQVTAPVQNVVRNAAAGERAGQKREALTATGEGTKEGDMWKSPQAAAKGTQQIQRFHRVRERLVALIEDVKTNGERIDLDSKEYVRRMSLAEAAAAALRPYNELSSTDASMAAERAIIGPAGAFGHGWTLGADLKTLQHILSEAEGQQQVNLSTLLRPGGGSRLSPSLGGQRQDGLPAGAIPGTMNGKRGYVLNGNFHATE